MPVEVRIEAGMLRDLRITTAAVESRRGDEQVTLLGELAVDERAYAEVGVPVPARVMRLLAGARRRRQARARRCWSCSRPRSAGRAREYLSAAAHLTLAESALKRKRDLAAERIAPQREVQEAEAACDGRARGTCAPRSVALSALGLRAPDEGDAEERRDRRCSRCASPVRRHGHRARAVRGQMLDPGDAGVPDRRPLDACG